VFVVVTILLWQIFSIVVIATLAVVKGSDVRCWASRALVHVSAAERRATGIWFLFVLLEEAPVVVFFVVHDL